MQREEETCARGSETRISDKGMQRTPASACLHTFMHVKTCKGPCVLQRYAAAANCTCRLSCPACCMRSFLGTVTGNVTLEAQFV